MEQAPLTDFKFSPVFFADEPEGFFQIFQQRKSIFVIQAADLSAHRTCVRHNICCRASLDGSKVQGCLRGYPSAGDPADGLGRRGNGTHTLFRRESGMGRFPPNRDLKIQQRRRSVCSRPHTAVIVQYRLGGTSCTGKNIAVKRGETLEIQSGYYVK